MATQNENINLNITIDASNAQKNTDNLRGRIKELTKQMAQLRLEGKENSAQYKQMAQEVGRLKDTLGDVAAETRALADDNRTLTATLQGMSTGIAVFSGLQSAAAMLGVEDENLLEVLTKLQAAQVLLNSVNTIAKNLNKDSALMIALRSKNTKVLTADIKAETSATVAGTTATKTFTKAQATATTGAKGLTKAVKGVGTAIKSVPVVGWILAAVGALTTLVTIVKDLNSEEEKGNKERETANKLLKDRVDLYNLIVDNSAKAQAIASQDKDYYTNLVASMKTMNRESARYADAIKEISNFTGLSEEYLKKHTSSLADIVKKQADYNQLVSKYNDFRQILLDKETELAKAKQQQTILERVEERMRKEGTASQYNYSKQQLEIQKATVSQIETEINFIKEGNTIREDDVKKAKDALYIYKEQALLLEKNEKKLEKNNELRNKQTQNTEESRRKSLEMDIVRSKEGAKKRLDAEINLLLDQQKAEKDALDKMYANGEVKAIDYMNMLFETIQKYRYKIEELVQKFNDEADKNELERIRKLEKSKSDTRIASAKEGSEEYFEALKERNDQEMAIELQDLADLHDCKLISEELYESEVDRIKAEHTKERDKIEKDSLEAIQQQRNDVMDSFAAVSSQTSALVTDMMETELEGVEQGSKKEKQIRKKYAIADMTMTIANISAETALAVMKSFEGYAELPFIGQVLGALQAAIMTATGIAQIAKAIQAKTQIMKAGRGMYINGRSHAQGGELIEAEGNEVIMNKNAVKAYGGLLSAINSSTGGIRFPQAENNNRGVIQTNVSDASLERIVAKVVEGTASIPVIVSERSITDSQARVVSISNYARI